MTFDRDKFKRLFHYVIWKAGKRDGFGATKLYKVLWFSEADTYVLKRRPIVGATYIRQKHGPVPNLAVPIREELVREGRIKWWQGRRHNHPIEQFEATISPDMTGFAPDDLKTVNDWIDRVARDRTATPISEQSHDYAWTIAKMGEELPFYAFLASRIREPNDKELEQAKKRALELNLL